MIRINLLPKEQQKRKVGPNWWRILGIVGGVVVVTGLGYGWWMTKGAVEAIRAEIASTRLELQRYAAQAKQVDQLKADKQRLEERQAAIDRLLASQQGPVKLLDELSRLLPPEVWLNSLNKTKNRLVIQGYAFSDEKIADLMTSMGKAAPLFREVELSFSEKTNFEQVPVKRFEITANVR